MSLTYTYSVEFQTLWSSTALGLCLPSSDRTWGQKPHPWVLHLVGLSGLAFRAQLPESPQAHNTKTEKVPTS